MTTDERLLYRCDLEALGEDALDLDLYRNPDADRYGQALALRQTRGLRVTTSTGSQPEANLHRFVPEGMRLQVTPDDTEFGLYTTCEWAAGPGEHFDQPGLEAGAAVGDGRVFMVGRRLTFRTRFAPAYQAGTALGTAGMIGQDWRSTPIADRPDRLDSLTEYELLSLSISYVGPQGQPFSTILSRSRTPRLAALVLDYTTGTLWSTPVSRDVDVSKFHDWSIDWDVARITFAVDGRPFGTFRQGQRALCISLTQRRLASPWRRGYALATPLQPDVWLDNNMARSPKMDERCAYTDTQWVDVQRVEVHQR